jgi:hypothetical protein
MGVSLRGGKQTKTEEAITEFTASQNKQSGGICSAQITDKQAGGNGFCN